MPYLKLMRNKSSLKLGICSKIATCFYGPIEILDTIGSEAYALTLSACFHVHNVFHVPLLNKYVYDLNHVIYWDMIQVEPEGDIPVQPVCILDGKDKLLRNRTIE